MAVYMLEWFGSKKDKDYCKIGKYTEAIETKMQQKLGVKHREFREVWKDNKLLNKTQKCPL